MKVNEIFESNCGCKCDGNCDGNCGCKCDGNCGCNCNCKVEAVMVDEHDNVLTESAIRQFKRVGNEIKRKFRCLSGPKKGKLVSTPNACAQRKHPKKVRQGKKVMRSKKGTIKRKSKLAKKRAMSKIVAKMNKKLSGK